MTGSVEFSASICDSKKPFTFWDFSCEISALQEAISVVVRVCLLQAEEFARLQKSLVCHAMEFPNVQRVVYSTCSENQVCQTVCVVVWDVIAAVWCEESSLIGTLGFGHIFLVGRVEESVLSISSYRKSY